MLKFFILGLIGFLIGCFLAELLMVIFGYVMTRQYHRELKNREEVEIKILSHEAFFNEKDRKWYVTLDNGDLEECTLKMQSHSIIHLNFIQGNDYKVNDRGEEYLKILKELRNNG